MKDDNNSVGVSGQTEEGVYSPMSPSFWCYPILDQSLNTCGSKVDSICGNTLHEVYLCRTFLYYLFAYDDAHAFEWRMLLEDKSVN